MSAPPSTMAGPGLLFVKARISRPDIMDEKTYMKWYDDDHIAEIIETSGFHSGFRYIRQDRDKLSDKEYPYLALYPMDDVAFLRSDEFKKIRVHSDMLPGNGLVYDLADYEVRYYGLRGVLDETKKGKGHNNTIVPAQFELKDGFSEESFEAWIKDTHISQFSGLPGYLRSSIFKLWYARTNAQSRALKGLATTDEPGPEPPTWLVFHEFENDRVDEKVVKQVRAGDKDTGKFDLVEMPVYGVARRHGQADWFHER